MEARSFTHDVTFLAAVLATTTTFPHVTVSNPTEPSTAGGLSSADLIAILALIVTMFGLLLTAIGVLVLRQFTGLDNRITETKSDTANALNAIWRELGLLRSRIYGTPPPNGTIPPDAIKYGRRHDDIPN